MEEEKRLENQSEFVYFSGKLVKKNCGFLIVDLTHDPMHAAQLYAWATMRVTVLGSWMLELPKKYRYYL